MKKLFRLIMAAFLAVGLSVAMMACEPETEVKTDEIIPSDTIPIIVPMDTISFEDVVLDSTGYWNGSDLSGTLSSYESWGTTISSYSGSYKSGILNCPNHFYEDQTFNSTWWDGMACSSKTDKETIGYANQYSVYASSGAGGSQNFALIGSDGAQCSFDQPIQVKSLMVNNSTYVYWALKDGRDGYGAVRKFVSGDYFTVTVTGYDSTGVKTSQVEIPLADFRNSQTYICSDWTKISLVALGKVKSLAFKFNSSDTGDYGINTPAYFCIDNLVYDKK